jgi:type I restriction enzyme S subunit
MGNESDILSAGVNHPQDLPPDWRIRSLVDLCLPRQYPTIPQTSLKTDGYPVYGANGIIGYWTSYTHASPTIAITCRGATCGIVNRTVGKSYITGNAMALDEVSGEVDEDFLYQALIHRRVSDAISGTAQPQITRHSLRRVKLPLPPLSEQRRIAALLHLADVVIERTRESAANVERLKRALMQQLLPPWIGFKRIPDDALGAGIESHLAGTVCRVKNGSTPSRMEYLYWNKGTIPWLATGKVNERIIRYADEFVTEKALAECSIELLPAGTVLVGMIGQGRTRGMAAYLDMSACINQNFGAFVPGEKVVGKFLYHYFCFHYDRLRDMGGGTNQGALNCYILKRIRLALPKPEVQMDIARVLDGCDDLIEKHNTKLNVLQRLKRGLMQDLLTGKVRVPASLEVAGA